MASSAIVSSASAFMPLLAGNYLPTNQTLDLSCFITSWHGLCSKHHPKQFLCCCVMQLSHRPHREHSFSDSPLVCVRNLLHSSGHCLQGRCLALALHATIFLLLIFDCICFFPSILIFFTNIPGGGGLMLGLPLCWCPCTVHILMCSW
jgi:hypothetical protein